MELRTYLWDSRPFGIISQKQNQLTCAFECFKNESDQQPSIALVC